MKVLYPAIKHGASRADTITYSTWLHRLRVIFYLTLLQTNYECKGLRLSHGVQDIKSNHHAEVSTAKATHWHTNLLMLVQILTIFPLTKKK